MNKPVIIPNANPDLMGVWVGEVSATSTNPDYDESPIVAWAITPEENEDPDTIDPDLCGRPICVQGYVATVILSAASGRVWEVGSMMPHENLERYFKCLRARVEGDNRRRAARKAATP